MPEASRSVRSPVTETTRVLVVGVGSDLRRDDAVGRVVADEIDARRIPGVRVCSVPQLVPELAEAMIDVERVVFIDAAISIDAIEVGRVVPGRSPSGSHHGDPASLLALADLIGGPVPEAFVVRVPVTDLGFGPDLTPGCRSSVDLVVDSVLDVVGRPPFRPRRS